MIYIKYKKNKDRYQHYRTSELVLLVLCEFMF